MRPIHILALVPIAAVLIGPLFLNRVFPFILGMPFLLGWLALSLVVTSIVMACIYHSDRAAGVIAQETLAGEEA